MGLFVVDLTKQEKLARLRILRSGSIGVTTFWNMIQLYGSGIEALHAIPVLSKSALKKSNYEAKTKFLKNSKN